jgi:hypothetical protein
MAKFETVAAYTGFGLGILNGGIAVITLWRSRKEAVRTRQRALRGELRDVLREIDDACTEYYNGEIEFLMTSFLREGSTRVQRLRDEGLLSPGDTHLQDLQGELQGLEDRWQGPTALPQHGMSIEERQQLFETNRDEMDWNVERLHRLVGTYLRATAKMDNGSLLAYLRYKRPWISR